MLPLPDASLGCVATCQPALASLQSIEASGSWSDINYTNADRTVWTATLHLERTLAMARAMLCEACPSAPVHELQSAVSAALTYWLTLDPTAPQWWWKQIGEPQVCTAQLLAVLVQPPVAWRHLSRLVCGLGRSLWPRS